MKEADESKVATSEKQKTELKEEAAKKTLVEYFDDSKRTLWENRLRETAYVLAATGRPDDAKVAWATGITLGKKGSDVEKIPFAKDLVFKILRAADHDHAGHDHAEHDHAHGPSAEMRAQSEGPAGKT